MLDNFVKPGVALASQFIEIFQILEEIARFLDESVTRRHSKLKLFLSAPYEQDRARALSERLRDAVFVLIAATALEPKRSSSCTGSGNENKHARDIDCTSVPNTSLYRDPSDWELSSQRGFGAVAIVFGTTTLYGDCLEGFADFKYQARAAKLKSSHVLEGAVVRERIAGISWPL
ncbi:hypothetical protein B0H13DRAFT_1874754 [Mycena leptocephala]|nr:hypothetical protein B0H13DRAFT_1874754 [Mycena leptocephala]